MCKPLISWKMQKFISMLTFLSRFITIEVVFIGLINNLLAQLKLRLDQINKLSK